MMSISVRYLKSRAFQLNWQKISLINNFYIHRPEICPYKDIYWAYIDRDPVLNIITFNGPFEIFELFGLVLQFRTYFLIVFNALLSNLSWKTEI